MPAGIDWAHPFNEQVRDDLLWKRDDYIYEPIQLSVVNNSARRPYHRNIINKTIVTGHTPVQTIRKHSVILTMKHDAEDTPRYLIDAGSRSGAYNGGITALTLNEDGSKQSSCTVINGTIYNDIAMVK